MNATFCRIGIALGACIALIVCLPWTGCRGDPDPTADGGVPVPQGGRALAPVLSALEPRSAVVHTSLDPAGSGLLLTLRGTGFAPESQVVVPSLGRPWDSRAWFWPMVISDTELQVRIDNEWLRVRPQVVDVHVRTGAGDSNPLPLELRSPRPMLGRLDWQGSGGPDELTLLMVRGSGFVEGAEILWNGRPRRTHVSGPDSASTELAPADIHNVPCAVAVRNPAPGEQTSNSLTCPLRMYAKKVGVRVGAMVWDERRRRIYASEGPKLWVVDPEQPESARSIDLECGALALTSDQRYLYAGGSGVIRRLDLDTETVDSEWPVESGVEYISVAPTRPGRVAATLPGVTGYLQVFENGRPIPTPECGTCGIHVFSDDQTLHAFNNHTTGFQQYQFAVSETEVTQRFVIPHGVAGVVDQIAVDGQRLLVGTHGPSARAERIGQALDVRTGLEVGRYTGERTICPDRRTGRLFMASDPIEDPPNGSTVWVSDLDGYDLLYSFKVWGISGIGPGDLIRWGERGLAFTGRGEGIFLFELPPEVPLFRR